MAQNVLQVNRTELQNAIVKLALDDESFRQQLLQDPKKALRASAGFEPPAGVDIKVIQEDRSCMYIVLPVRDETLAEGDELTDDQLAAVAGGVGTSASLNNASRLQLGTESSMKSTQGLSSLTVCWG